MQKIPRDDRRAKYMSSDIDVDANELAEHLAGQHHWVLSTTRADGRPQMSLVTGGMIADGRLAISTYPGRVKAKNARRNPLVSVAVMGDEFNSADTAPEHHLCAEVRAYAGDAFRKFLQGCQVTVNAEQISSELCEGANGDAEGLKAG